MKRNTFMKRLAVTALAATMTLGTVPATAVATFAETKAEATSADVNTDSDANKQLDTEVSSAIQNVKGLTKDSTAADLQNALQDALNNLGVGRFVVAVKADTFKVGDMNENNIVPITATVSVSKYDAKGDNTVNGEYDVESDITVETNTFTNQQRVNTVAKDVQNYLNSYELFSATGTPTASEVKNVIDSYLASDKFTHKDLLKNVDGKSISYTVSVDSSKSTESTQIQRGSVAGTVVFNLAKVDEKKNAAGETTVKADAAASATVDFEAHRAFSTAALNSDMIDKFVKPYLENKTYPNDVTAEDITADVNKAIREHAVEQQKKGDNTWNGITASIGTLTAVDKQSHSDDSNETGSFTSSVSLTDGTNTLAATFKGKLKHSNTEKLDELDKAITTEAGKYSVSKIQKANDTKPAVSATVVTAINTILKNAVGERINNKTISQDGWSNNFKVSERPSSEGVVVKNDDNAVANVIDAKYDYTEATPKKEGSIKVDVTYALTNELDSTKTDKKTTSFTITLPKLKAQKTTYLTFTKSAVPAKYDPTATEKKNTIDLTDANVSGFDRNGNDELVWTSSNPSAVTVNSDGKAVLKGVGEATITVTDADNTALTASIVVNSDEYFVFKDVQNANSYYFTPVYEAKRNKVTSGVSDDEFGVGTSVTRAQMITWLWNAAGKPAASAKSNFTDVSENAFYAKAVDWAVSEGITAGKSATKFGSNDPVTRAQLVQFLYKEYGQGVKYNATVNFNDVSENAYYYDAVQWAVAKNITAGKTATKFAPNDDCTREQGITFLYKASNYFMNLNSEDANN